jgi:hypothetical protein
LQASDEAAWEMPAPESAEASEPIEAETSYSPISDEQPVWEMPAPASFDASEPAEAEPSYSPASEEQSAWEMPAAPTEEESYEPMAEEPGHETWSEAPAIEEPAVEPEPEPISVMVKGRVQVRIAPVPDFDRLLNLDGALSRVKGVDSVTLADYAQEEVTFRVEVLSDKDAGLFAREIAEAAGVNTTLVDAVDNGLIIRIN